jgi:hypothetical protein
MEGYNRLKRLIIVLIVSYFIIGISTEVIFAEHGRAMPPFFSWFLFKHVPNEKYSTMSTIRILSARGRTFSPPMLYGKAYGIVKDPNSGKSRLLITQLANNLEVGNESEAEKLRKGFEENFLLKPTHYEVVHLKFNPLDFYKEGKIHEIIRLGEFRYE